MILKLRLLIGGLIVVLLNGGCKKRETEKPSRLPEVTTPRIHFSGASFATGGGWLACEGSSALMPPMLPARLMAATPFSLLPQACPATLLLYQASLQKATCIFHFKQA